MVAEILLEFGQHLADAVDVGHGRLELGDVHVAEVEGKVELGADLSGRTRRDVQKMQELVGGMALKAFGDVRDDGYGRAADLVAEAVVATERRPTRERINPASKRAGLLPDFQIFKSLKLCHVLPTIQRCNNPTIQRSNDPTM